VTAPPLMDSFWKIVVSLPTTKPVPAVPPPVRAAVMVVEKPSAPKAGDELETDRSCAVPVCSVIAPLDALIVGATPVMAPIFASKVPTVSVTSIELPAVPVLTNVSVVPSTTMVSPTAKFVVSESLGEAPDSVVAAVIGAAVAALFKAAAPVTVASPNGVGGVPTGKGFWLKSEGFKPPAANNVPAVAVVLAGVVGVVGRFAAY
jgi:hypothetical protein